MRAGERSRAATRPAGRCDQTEGFGGAVSGARASEVGGVAAHAAMSACAAGAAGSAGRATIAGSVQPAEPARQIPSVLRPQSQSASCAQCAHDGSPPATTGIEPRPNPRTRARINRTRAVRIVKGVQRCDRQRYRRMGERACRAAVDRYGSDKRRAGEFTARVR
jgi:hypothetical protein